MRLIALHSVFCKPYSASRENKTIIYLLPEYGVLVLTTMQFKLLFFTSAMLKMLP